MPKMETTYSLEEGRIAGFVTGQNNMGDQQWITVTRSFWKKMPNGMPKALPRF